MLTLYTLMYIIITTIKKNLKKRKMTMTNYIENFLSEETVEKLANDDDSFVRVEVAGFNKLSEEIIEKLADDDDSFVKSAIARRKDLSADMIEKLANDDDFTVRKFIAERKAY